MHIGNTYIAGIFDGPSVGGSEVFVTSTGELGTISSSQRFKEDIEDMGDASAALMKLRPVVFHYKTAYDDGAHQLQYGLIAEEVAKVYPELVQLDKEGLPRSVRYHFLSSMLLNEAQKQRAALDQQAETIAAQAQQIAQQQTAIGALGGQLDALRLQLERLATKLEATPPPASP
jgi:septal ring factor EnvC (AmiA/AmiB activator)